MKQNLFHFLFKFPYHFFASAVLLYNVGCISLNSENNIFNFTQDAVAETNDERSVTTEISSPVPAAEQTNTEVDSEEKDQATLPEPAKDSENEDDDDEAEDPAPPISVDDEEMYDFGTSLIIKAINPGYTLPVGNDKLSDVGEFIELQNLTDAPIALAGYSLKYNFGGSSTATVFTFPEDSYMTGKHLLLRYQKSPEQAQADLTYSKSLAFDSGPLRLIYADEDGNETLLDSVCWRKDAELCQDYHATEYFQNKDHKRKVAVRNLASGDFEQLNYDEYLPEFTPGASGLYLPPESDEDNAGGENSETPNRKLPQCRGLEFSELLTYYEEDKAEQFIEFFNPTNADINLSGCTISYKNKTYPLEGVVKSGGYLAYHQSTQFALTKNPKNPSVLTLIDADETPLDEVAYPNGQKKLTSYAKIFSSDGNDTWQLTYAITPGSENIYQKFRNCEEGKIINEATGNCVKVTSVKTATTAITKSLAPCPAGKYRNPLTGRCKNIETTSSTLKECAEGYERNPETNRCRKITKPNQGEDFALAPVATTDKTAFVGIGIVIIIVLLGLVYIILQFRHEIARAARKIGQRVNHIRQNLLSGSIGRHPHK